jgi:hypothetical protein
MILRDVGQFLAKQGRMSLRDLARHFDSDEDAMDAMLGVWMRKGRIRKLALAGCSGSCCTQRQEVLYEWLPENQIGLITRNF